MAEGRWTRMLGEALKGVDVPRLSDGKDNSTGAPQRSGSAALNLRRTALPLAFPGNLSEKAR